MVTLTFQDIAAEQSTMAYRAPELFDVKTGVTLDEKVDIWVRFSASYIPWFAQFTLVARLHTVRNGIFTFSV